MSSIIVEYVASGKPIIHFAVNSADPVIELLKSYPLAKTVNLKTATDELELTLFIQENTTSVLSYGEIKSIFRRADPEYIAAIIQNNFT